MVAAPTALPVVARVRTVAETVLVVDDADGFLELVRRLLERQGYTVLLAQNAHEAERLFQAHPSIDVLLTDVVMPGASGFELTRRLCEQRPRLKVVYMSGYPAEAIARHGVLNPGVALLHKPFTAEMLSRKIREALDR
jgi:CheY-like chemotaxis protein